MSSLQSDIDSLTDEQRLLVLEISVKSEKIEKLLDDCTLPMLRIIALKNSGDSIRFGITRRLLKS